MNFNDLKKELLASFPEAKICFNQDYYLEFEVDVSAASNKEVKEYLFNFFSTHLLGDLKVTEETELREMKTPDYQIGYFRGRDETENTSYTIVYVLAKKIKSALRPLIFTKIPVGSKFLFQGEIWTKTSEEQAFKYSESVEFKKEAVRSFYQELVTLIPKSPLH